MNKQHIRVNCLDCKHYHVTWDKVNPKGCRAFGFKTSIMPAMTVWQTTGEICGLFEKKERPQKK